MQASATIDWFNGSATSASSHPFPSRNYEYSFLPRKGWQGYDVGEVETKTEIKRFSSSLRKDMGFAILAEGSALERLAYHHESHSVVKAMFDTGFREYRASRIDLAFDLHDGGEIAQRVYELASQGKVVSKARKQHGRKDFDGGDGVTTYFGSRESTRFFRVYDKKAESGGREPVSRFEMQCNGKFAAQAWKSLKSPEDSAVLGCALAAINGFVVDWGDTQINRYLQQPVEIVPENVERIANDKWDWIVKQVLPTLQRDFDEKHGEGDTFLERLNQIVKRQL